MPPACCAVAEDAARCGVDTVQIARIERLLAETAPEDLGAFFAPQELADAGDGPGRAASLAARFAAKEACTKLFPREATLGAIGPVDFSVARDGYGAPSVVLSDAAQLAMGLVCLSCWEGTRWRICLECINSPSQECKAYVRAGAPH